MATKPKAKSPAKKKAGARPKENFLTRGRRLVREIKPYLPGLTRDAAARMINAPPQSIAKLSSNENPLGPSPKVLDAIRDMNPLVHEYPNAGAADVKRAVGRFLGVDPDQVVVGAGSSTLMHSIVEAFSTPGGEVISLKPGFNVYPEIARIHGRVGTQIPLRSKDFLLDIATLKKAISAKTQIIFLTRPNNPTSTLIPLEVFAEAARLGAKVGALVISDEAYIEFSDIPKQSAAELLKSDPKTYANVMFTRTCSKAFGIANLRVGYAVGSKELAKCLNLANAKWPTGAVAQAAAVAAFGDTGHLAKTLKMVSEGRAWLTAELNAMGLPVTPGAQGNYIMVDVKPSGLSAQAFSEKVFRDDHVLIRGDFSPRYLRVSIGTTEDNRRMAEAARKLVK